MPRPWACIVNLPFVNNSLSVFLVTQIVTDFPVIEHMGIACPIKAQIIFQADTFFLLTLRRLTTYIYVVPHR
jgi:hypothetical protein